MKREVTQKIDRKRNGRVPFLMVQFKRNQEERSLGGRTLEQIPFLAKIPLIMGINQTTWMSLLKERKIKSGNLFAKKRLQSRERMKSSTVDQLISTAQAKERMELWWLIQLTGETYNKPTQMDLRELQTIQGRTKVLLKIGNSDSSSQIFCRSKTQTQDQPCTHLTRGIK